MRKSILLLYAFLTLACQAQTDEWHNASKNAVNRQPMHTSYFAYESQQKAYFLSVSHITTTSVAGGVTLKTLQCAPCM